MTNSSKIKPKDCRKRSSPPLLKQNGQTDYLFTFNCDERKKISADLKDYLQKNGDQGQVEVVMELTPLPDDTGVQHATRSAKITAFQQAFAKSLEPVTDLIASQGGDVLDSAWVNQTVKAMLPVGSLPQLAQLNEVTAIDLPHTLSAD